MNKFSKKTRVVVGAVVGVIVIVILAVSFNGGSKPASVVTPTMPPTSSAPVAPAPVQTPPPPAPSTPAAPAMTASQQQAVESAQSYLSDGTGFSQEGLQQQLTSSYGEGFAKADAQFAINYLHPDWNAQAVESAQNYVNDGTGFSKSSLTQQLTSTYGEGFTQAQATYAVNKVMG